jgi:hypothetical protein
MISLACPHDCGHPVLIDTRVSNHYDPTWLCTRAICGALFHGLRDFTKSLYQIAPGSCKPKFAFLTKIVVAHRLINPRVGFTDYEFLNCLGTTVFKAQQ